MCGPIADTQTPDQGEDNISVYWSTVNSHKTPKYTNIHATAKYSVVPSHCIQRSPLQTVPSCCIKRSPVINSEIGCLLKGSFTRRLTVGVGRQRSKRVSNSAWKSTWLSRHFTSSVQSANSYWIANDGSAQNYSISWRRLQGWLSTKLLFTTEADKTQTITSGRNYHWRTGSPSGWWNKGTSNLYRAWSSGNYSSFRQNSAWKAAAF